MHMDITPYVASLRADLVGAAEAAGQDARAAAERLTQALEPAVRLMLMEALSDAAAQITTELPDGTVEVRLKGREPQLVVDVPRVAGGTTLAELAEDKDEDDTVARITLRIPESVKTRAEALAGRSGHSLNSWIVNVVRAATASKGAVNVDIDLSSIPFFDEPRTSRAGTRRMSGWV